MNEQYLFRGKDESGDWIEGSLVACPEGNFDIYDCLVDLNTFYHVADNATIGRCTGERDKNGTLIFEGDIVTSTAFRQNMVAVVKFGKIKSSRISNDYPCGHIGFYVEWIEDLKGLTRQDLIFWLNKSIGNTVIGIEVIGNIHDNTDLLDNSDLLKDDE